jgi:hypothetical protein
VDTTEGQIKLIVDGRVMSPRLAERLLPWMDRFSN